MMATKEMRIVPIVDSFIIERGEGPSLEWLAPDRTWVPNCFESAHLESLDKAQWWLLREGGEIAGVTMESLEKAEARP